MPTNDCGCVEEDNTIYACQLHGDQAFLSMAMSHMGFCGECCDGPAMRREVERIGKERARTAIEGMRPAHREYGLKLLEDL